MKLINEAHLGSDGTQIQALEMVKKLQARGYAVDYGDSGSRLSEDNSGYIPDDVWFGCLSEVCARLGAPLHSLPDSEFDLGGEIDTLARAAGYASGRQWANDMDMWPITVEEAIETLTSEQEQPIQVGDRVGGGEGEDHDTGRVDSIDGDMATVSWDSGVVTTAPLSGLTAI